MSEPRKFYTVRELQEDLAELVERDPSWADIPVHLLNCEPDGDGLLTHVEIDMFDEDVGEVMSLYSYPSIVGVRAAPAPVTTPEETP